MIRVGRRLWVISPVASLFFEEHYHRILGGEIKVSCFHRVCHELETDRQRCSWSNHDYSDVDGIGGDLGGRSAHGVFYVVDCRFVVDPHVPFASREWLELRWPFASRG